jgi:predicted PurR-regulated permease PerM
VSSLAPTHAPATAPRAARPGLGALGTVVLIVAVLARAEAIFVPLALAIVVAFALGPVVRLFEGALGRVAAVAVVVFCALAAVGGFSYLLQRQVVDLSTEMTKYSASIQRKMIALRGSQGSGLGGLSKTVDRAVRNLDEQVEADQGARPVRLVPAEATALERIGSALAPIVAPLARAGIVLVLIIFFLIKREDLRDRFIRLVGRGHVTLTTRALDEAGHRIGRFLAQQSAINASFGVAVGAGLLGIGIPYAPLWGFVAAVLRFVPYVGTLFAMAVPAALAFAQFPGWWQLGATLGLFLGLDVFVGYVIEPIVIGAKTGVSPMAMLLSAIFWSWLWGPVGLVLSTPLTVCLAVLGKHVPRLSSLAVLLDDKPALEDQMVLYHRLLSGDEEEAQEILDKRFREKTRAQVFDEIIIPALLLAERDRARGEISESDHQHVVRTIRALAETAPEAPSDSKATAQLRDSRPTQRPIQRIVGVSARTVTDETIWEMLAQLFDPETVQMESVGSSYLASDATSGDPGGVSSDLPDLVCVVSVPPGGLAQARYICRRLRAKLPNTPVVVIRPGGQANGEESSQRLTEDGAQQVCFTLESARTTIEQVIVGKPAMRPVLEPALSERRSAS